MLALLILSLCTAALSSPLNPVIALAPRGEECPRHSTLRDPSTGQILRLSAHRHDTGGRVCLYSIDGGWGGLPAMVATPSSVGTAIWEADAELYEKLGLLWERSNKATSGDSWAILHDDVGMDIHETERFHDLEMLQPSEEAFNQCEADIEQLQESVVKWLSWYAAVDLVFDVGSVGFRNLHFDDAWTWHRIRADFYLPAMASSRPFDKEAWSIFVAGNGVITAEGGNEKLPNGQFKWIPGVCAHLKPSSPAGFSHRFGEDGDLIRNH